MDESHDAGGCAPPIITSAPTSYETLYACYRSGQMSEKQWQDHLAADDLFRAWVERKKSA